MGNYMFFRMHRITDIYFVGGFGTVQWIDVNEYLTATPDAIATNSPASTLQVCYGWCCRPCTNLAESVLVRRRQLQLLALCLCVAPRGSCMAGLIL